MSACPFPGCTKQATHHAVLDQGGVTVTSYDACFEHAAQYRDNMVAHLIGVDDARVEQAEAES